MKHYLLLIFLCVGFSAKAQGPYCPYSFTDSTSQYPHCITNVKLGNNSNYTGNAQVPFPHYIQYGSLGAYAFGVTYPIEISVSPSSRYRYVTAYIDYNHDGSFGAFEYIASGLVAPGDTLFADVFPVWTIGFSGNTGLRVIVADDSSIVQNGGALLIDACSSIYMWGEVEDYTVSTQAGTTGLTSIQEDDIKLFPIPAKRYIQIENNSPIQNAILYSLDGKRLRSPLFDVTEKKLYVNGVASGVYLLKLTISGKEIVKKVVVE
jgi:hypothetical protein